MNLLSQVRGKAQRNRHYGCLEYATSCPWCGGTDRFHIYDLPPFGWFHCLDSKQGRAGCGRKGDGIQYVMLQTGATFADACQQLGIDPAQAGEARSKGWENDGHVLSTYSPKINTSWQMTALAFVRAAQALLSTFPIVVEYLERRGLTRDTIAQAHIGYYPSYKFVKGETWGLGQGKLLLPAGIVIPWLDSDGNVACLRIRRFPGDESQEAQKFYEDNRYRVIRGSSSGMLYRESTVRSGGNVALFEGEFDSLIAHQSGVSVATVATGSTAWGKANEAHVIGLLASAREVLVCFDTDANEAGEKASQWWLDRLGNAKRWRPLWKDANAMSESGADIGAWLSLGLHDESVKEKQADGTVETTPHGDFHCAMCEGEVEYYLEEGMPLCEKHYRMYEQIPVIAYEPTEEEALILDRLAPYGARLLYGCSTCGCRMVWRCQGDWTCVRCSPGILWSDELRRRIARLSAIEETQ